MPTGADSYKLIYTTQDEVNSYSHVFNEVHFFKSSAAQGSGPSEEEWEIFENRNLFKTGDEDNGMSINMQIKFTSHGTNLIFIDDTTDPPLMKTFV